MGLDLQYIALKVKALFSKKMKVSNKQVISFIKFKEPNSPILDLGGGGEGVIGLLYQEKVTALDNRQDELDEAPPGPIKVLGDARELPFEENHFESVTAFYFFMYAAPSDHLVVLTEAYRTLKPGGVLYIWDTFIEKTTSDNLKLCVVPVSVILPAKIIKTAYGVSWSNHPQNPEEFRHKIKEAGFVINKFSLNNEAFYFECQKL